MKSCPCGSPGPFYRNASRPDGLSCYCKSCTAVQRREEYARKYPDGKSGRGKGVRGALPGNKNAYKHGRSGMRKSRSYHIDKDVYETLRKIISMAIA